MFLDQPLARPHNRRPVLSTKQVDRFAGRARPWNLQRLSPTAQRRMVERCQLETEQTDDRADQPLGLTECQPEHRPQRQRCQDYQGRVVPLTARRRARLGMPGGDRCFGEPDGQAAALAEGGVILSPVRDPVPLARNVMTSISIELERHDGVLACKNRPTCYPIRLPSPTGIRATNSLPATSSPGASDLTRAMVNVGVRRQAAICSSVACTASPSRKRTPWISWASRSDPFRWRQ